MVADRHLVAVRQPPVAVRQRVHPAPELAEPRPVGLQRLLVPAGPAEKADRVLRRLAPGVSLKVTATAADGTAKSFSAQARIDTLVELDYYKHGGILQYVLRQLLKG